MYACFCPKEKHFLSSETKIVFYLNTFQTETSNTNIESPWILHMDPLKQSFQCFGASWMQHTVETAHHPNMTWGHLMKGFCRLKANPKHLIYAGGELKRSLKPPLHIPTESSSYTCTKCCNTWKTQRSYIYTAGITMDKYGFLIDLTHFNAGLLVPRYALWGLVLVTGWWVLSCGNTTEKEGGGGGWQFPATDCFCHMVSLYTDCMICGWTTWISKLLFSCQS